MRNSYNKLQKMLNNAINLRQAKDNKSDFYRQLQILNDKIVIYKDLQEKQKQQTVSDTKESSTKRHRK